MRRALTRLFARAIPESVDRILDLGCGTAYYWPLLAERCQGLIGIELSRAMAGCGQKHRAKLNSGISRISTLVCSEAAELPLASESIDVVLAIDALHHCADLQRVLGEVRRVLRPGGDFVAVEPNVYNPVVFTAHLIPPEERGALYPNYPRAVHRAIENALGEVTITPITYVSGLQSEPLLRFVELVEPLFEKSPLSCVALRRILRARRR